MEDSIEIAKKVGFVLIGEHKLDNIKRVYGTIGKEESNFNDNSERMLVFIKGKSEEV